MFWCHVHWWTPLCSNMVFVMDEQLLAQKSSNKRPLGFKSGSLFLPITPLRVTLALRMWVLKSPSKTIESPVRAPSGSPPRASTKAWYTALLFSPTHKNQLTYGLAGEVSLVYMDTFLHTGTVRDCRLLRGNAARLDVGNQRWDLPHFGTQRAHPWLHSFAKHR